jgi:hypothetical protein
VPTGSSQAEEFCDGIYKAALRAKGFQVEDGLAAFSATRASSTRVARPAHAR